MVGNLFQGFPQFVWLRGFLRVQGAKCRRSPYRQTLGVGAIVEGSVRSAGERIRITAQLISARDGLQIWSDSHQRQFTYIFKLQDELSTAIVEALLGTMNPSAASIA
jgi:TolB-like protein